MSVSVACDFLSYVSDIKAKAIKGVWWMPWLSEAMKDVISCDKLGLGANDL